MQLLGCEVAALNTVQYSTPAQDGPSSSRKDLIDPCVFQAITKPTDKSKAQQHPERRYVIFMKG